MTITEQMAAYALVPHWEERSDEERTLVKTALVDWITVAAVGSREQCSRIIDEILPMVDGQATVFGRKRSTRSQDAAFENAVSAHAQDFDDVHKWMSIHLTVPVISAAFACAEETKASGKELLNAILNGMQITICVASAIYPEHYEAGWHGTTTMGIFGATAAAAYLNKLTVNELCNAFGIAASTTCGIKANFGTYSKPLHQGEAARHGVEAVLLAKKGFTGNTNIFESKYLEMLTTNTDRTRMVPRLMGLHTINDICYKRYATSIPTHSMILNGKKINAMEGFSFDEVDHVEIESSNNFMKVLFADQYPKTGRAGQFSIPYVAIAALKSNGLCSETFTDTYAQDETFQSILQATKMSGIDSYNGTRNGKTRVFLKDGTVLEAESTIHGPDYTTQSKQNDVKEKYYEQMTSMLIAEDVNKLYSYVMNCEHLPSVSPISELLKRI